ncbi:hypothetical protein LSAT2_002852 [Lamellibrachia satsuma]|nr:hypothetical protein LSAT2_002852 [Lamellibrachia satsuma]
MPRDFYPESRGRRRNYPLGPPPPAPSAMPTGRSYDPEFDARNYGHMRGKMPPGPHGQRSGGKLLLPPAPKGSRADEYYPYRGNDERPHKDVNYELEQDEREIRKQKHKKSKHKRKHSKERAEKKMKKRSKGLVDYDDITSGSEEYSSMHNSPAPSRVSPQVEKPPRRRHSPATALQEYRKQLGDGSPFAPNEKMQRNLKSSKSRQHAPVPEPPKMYRAEAPKAYVDPPKAYRTPSRSPSPKKPRYKSRSPSPYSRRRSISPHR